MPSSDKKVVANADGVQRIQLRALQLRKQAVCSKAFEKIDLKKGRMRAHVVVP